MKYLARRLTGDRAWLHNDLPLTQVSRTRSLSGPGGISATIEPELREVWAEDGMRVIEDWGTIVYAMDDEKPDKPIVAHGIVVPPSNWTEAAHSLTCLGVAGYPHGMIYGESRIWGPEAPPKGSVSTPAVPRPDPLRIVQDLWDYLQAQQDSDLGVTLVGDLASSVRIGSYEEPYRLRWFEVPDIGEEIDRLAGSTPFDYVEDVAWTDATMTDVAHRIEIGWPRLGRQRDDLRFVQGENIVGTVPADSLDTYANDVVGIGNGEGQTMVMSRSTVRDGRIRRTKTVTDKTLGQYDLNRLTVTSRERVTREPDIQSITVKDSPSAPLTAINPGDDIYVQVHIPAYGPLNGWSRVLAITEADHADEATLSLRRSSAFLYSPTAEADL